MIKKIREINYTGIWDGISSDDIKINNISIFPPAKESIYIAKDENGNYGMVNSDESVFLPFEYDSITPLGFSLWQTKKKDKVGAFQLYFTEDNYLNIGWKLDCEYDYLLAEHDTLIKASKFSDDCRNDLTDIIFPKIDKKISNCWCENIAWDYYYIEEYKEYIVDYKTYKEYSNYIINATNGSVYDLDGDYTLMGCTHVEDKGIYMMFSDLDGNGIIVIRISNNGKIKKSLIFDDIPAVIYGPDRDGMNGVSPIAFIGESHGVNLYVDSDLNECEILFDSIYITTRFYGESVINQKINGILSDLYSRRNVFFRNYSLNNRIEYDFDNPEVSDEGKG